MLSQSSSSFLGVVSKGNTLSEVGPSSSFLLSPKLKSWEINGSLGGTERGDPGKSRDSWQGLGPFASFQRFLLTAILRDRLVPPFLREESEALKRFKNRAQEVT